MQILIVGIEVGTTYALLAIGFSLIWGVARLLNFTYVVFYMIAAYLVYVLNTLAGWNYFLAGILSIIITIILGMATYKLLLERVRAQEIVVIMVSMVLALFLAQWVFYIFSNKIRYVAPMIEGFITISGVQVLKQHIFALAIILLVIVGMWAFLSKTKLGVAIRATAQDREVVNLMGISEKKISFLVTGIGTAMAAICGVVVAPLYAVEPFMWFNPLLVVLAAVILGGLGSFKGSIIGAYVLAFVEVSVTFLLPNGAFVKGAFALALMVTVLLVRPEGLFGVMFEEERL
ncbi:branched-chain amino acid ABC transporter permease [Thermodesulfobacteriota bacterium]